MTPRRRSYRELSRLATFEERYRYLALRARVGDPTFGHDRFENQAFYRSAEWRHIRDAVNIRDNGCDLGVPGFEIHERVYIHHLNPLTLEELRNNFELAVDMDNLITTTHRTHNAIHYGDESLLRVMPVERQPGDTRLW